MVCIVWQYIAIQYLYYTLNGSRLTSQETDIKFFGIPICYAEYVALREFRVLKSIVDLLAAARSAKVQQVVLSRCLRPAPLQHTYIKHIYSVHETTPFGSFGWGSFGEKEMLENLNIWRSHSILEWFAVWVTTRLMLLRSHLKTRSKLIPYSAMMLHESLKIIRVAHRIERNLSSWTCSTKVSTMGILFGWDQRWWTGGCRMVCWGNDNRLMINIHNVYSVYYLGVVPKPFTGVWLCVIYVARPQSVCSFILTWYVEAHSTEVQRLSNDMSANAEPLWSLDPWTHWKCWKGRKEWYPRYPFCDSRQMNWAMTSLLAHKDRPFLSSCNWSVEWMFWLLSAEWFGISGRESHKGRQEFIWVRLLPLHLTANEFLWKNRRSRKAILRRFEWRLTHVRTVPGEALK